MLKKAYDITMSVETDEGWEVIGKAERMEWNEKPKGQSTLTSSNPEHTEAAWRPKDYEDKLTEEEIRHIAGDGPVTVSVSEEGIRVVSAGGPRKKQVDKLLGIPAEFLEAEDWKALPPRNRAERRQSAKEERKKK